MGREMRYHIVIPQGQYNCPECGSDKLGSFCHGCHELICACRPSGSCPAEEDRQREEQDFYEHQREEQEIFEERQAEEGERFYGR